MSAIRDLPREQKKSHYRNLVAMALNDGNLTKEEESVLEYVAQKWDISKDDTLDVIDHLEATRLVLPESPLARFHQLFDLVDIMIADGKLKKAERELCESLALGLGFPIQAVDVVKDGILESNRLGTPEAEVHNTIRRKVEDLGPA